MCLFSQTSKTSTVHFTSSELLFSVLIQKKKLLHIQKIKLIFIPEVLKELPFQSRIFRYYFCFFVCVFVCVWVFLIISMFG